MKENYAHNPNAQKLEIKIGDLAMAKTSCCVTDVVKCDTFEFMQNVIGLPILHPGGLKATDTMAHLCEINSSKKVLDIACGPGFNDDYLVKKYGCSIVGIDINPSAITQAQKRVQQQGLQDKLKFMLANAQKLPFADNEFAVTLFEAVLIMVGDQTQALREAIRVTQSGGYIGVLELTWKIPPPQSFFAEGQQQCEFFKNAKTFTGWKKLIFTNSLIETASEKYDMECPCGFKEMGLKRSLNVFLKQLFNAPVRNRMKSLDKFISQNDQYFGYGIYVGKKK